MAYRHHDVNVDYKVVSFVDVHHLVPFSKKSFQTSDLRMREEARIENELRDFIAGIAKRAKFKMHFIGHERVDERHSLRFLVENGGYVEIFVDKPFTMNGHFITTDHAERFADALKDSLDHYIPDQPVKKLMIDSITIDDGFTSPAVSAGAWSWMHRYAVKHTVLASVVAVVIFGTIEFTKLLVSTSAVFTSHNLSVFFSLATAILIAFLLEPLRGVVDRLLEKLV